MFFPPQVSMQRACHSLVHEQEIHAKEVLHTIICRPTREVRSYAVSCTLHWWNAGWSRNLPWCHALFPCSHWGFKSVCSPLANSLYYRKALFCCHKWTFCLTDYVWRSTFGQRPGRSTWRGESWPNSRRGFLRWRSAREAKKCHPHCSPSQIRDWCWFIHICPKHNPFSVLFFLIWNDLTGWIELWYLAHSPFSPFNLLNSRNWKGLERCLN